MKSGCGAAPCGGIAGMKSGCGGGVAPGVATIAWGGGVAGMKSGVWAAGSIT